MIFDLFSVEFFTDPTSPRFDQIEPHLYPLLDKLTSPEGVDNLEEGPAAASIAGYGIRIQGPKGGIKDIY